jgi:hypothetical protein
MNWHREHKARMRFGDRMAEWMSRRIGSTPSSFLHTMAFIACIVAVTLGEGAANTMLLALTTVETAPGSHKGALDKDPGDIRGLPEASIP